MCIQVTGVVLGVVDLFALPLLSSLVVYRETFVFSNSKLWLVSVKCNILQVNPIRFQHLKQPELKVC